MFSDKTYGDDKVAKRRELVFLLLSGIFLGSLAMLNVLGVSRFIDLSDYIGISDSSDFRFVVAVGVLPYPITFFCTDLISELYGRSRANSVVWVGLILNIWILSILWLGGWLDAPTELTEYGELPITVIDGKADVPYGYVFYEIRKMAFGATVASMIAYLSAQFIDVHIFHYIKQKTRGKFLWLRNNVSTMTSQLVDSIAVILITYYYAQAIPINEGEDVGYMLLMFILSSYAFKVIFALLDTIPIYLAVKYLRIYLNIKDEIN